jgi:hypothetical protein
MKLRSLGMMTGKEETNDIDFAEDNDTSDEEVAPTTKNKETFALENTMEVNIDDI